MKRVYILCADDYEAVVVWHSLHNAGYVPYCPNVMRLVTWQMPVCDLDEHHREWLSTCDAVYQVGDTNDPEVLGFAESLGKPILTDINDLQRRGGLRVISA